VDPTAGLDDVEKRKFLTLPGLELRLLGRSAGSQPLSRLLQELLVALHLHSGGWGPNWVHSARRPLTGLLYLPRVIGRMENLVE
jgi:hypothetical protein